MTDSMKEVDGIFKNSSIFSITSMLMFLSFIFILLLNRDQYSFKSLMIISSLYLPLSVLQSVHYIEGKIKNKTNTNL